MGHMTPGTARSGGSGDRKESTVYITQTKKGWGQGNKALVQKGGLR